MRNKFTIKNGFNSEGDSIISGSFTILGPLVSTFTTASIVYSGSNITQVTQSFDTTQQITNIIYSGSFEDGNPLSISVTGSDGVNKLYTLTYSASLVTQIIQS